MAWLQKHGNVYRSDMKPARGAGRLRCGFPDWFPIQREWLVRLATVLFCAAPKGHDLKFASDNAGGLCWYPIIYMGLPGVPAVHLPRVTRPRIQAD